MSLWPLGTEHLFPLLVFSLLKTAQPLPRMVVNNSSEKMIDLQYNANGNFMH